MKQLAEASNLSELAQSILELCLKYSRGHGARLWLPHSAGHLHCEHQIGHGWTLSEDTVLAVWVQRSPAIQFPCATLPIGHGQTWGVVELIGINQYGLDDLEELFIWAGLALEATFLREYGAQRSQEAQAVADLMRGLGGSLDLPQILAITAKFSVERLGLDRAFIGLYPKHPTHLHAHILDQVCTYGFSDQLQTHIAQGLPYLQQQLTPEPVLFHGKQLQHLPEIIRELNLGGLSGIMVPILARGQTLGVLYIDGTQSQPMLSDTEKWLAVALAEQAALAIDNARLYQEESRKRQASEALREIASTLAGTLHLGDILERILEEARIFFRATACAIFQVGDDEHTLSIRSSLGLDTDYILQVRSQLGVGVIGKAVSSSQPQMMTNIQQDFREQPQNWYHLNPFVRERLETQSYPFCGVIGLPLANRGEVFGGLAMYFVDPIYLSPEDLALLEVFAGHAALAIANARLYEEEVRRERETGVLLDLARCLGLEGAGLHDDVVHRIANAMGADRCAIVQLSSNGQVQAIYRSGITDQDITSINLKNSKYRWLRRYTVKYLQLDLALPDAHRALMAPIYNQNHLIGFVYADVLQENPLFGERAMHLLSAVADQVALALNNQHLIHALKRQESQYRLLAETAQDLIISTNRSGNINYANPASSQILGYHNLEDLNFRSLLPLSSQNKLLQAWRRCLRHPHNGEVVEVEIVRADQSTAYIELHINALRRHHRVIGALAVGRDLSEQRRLTAEMTQRGQDLQLSEARRSELRSYLWLFTQAQEEERKRISRELHDDTAQVLVAITRRIDRLSSMLEDPLLRARTEDIRGDLELAIASVRRFSRNLRPSVLDDLGLLPALEWLAQQAQTPVRLEISGHEHRLKPDIELTLFRTIQEALTNMDKHAQAQSGAIRVEFTNQEVQVRVSDDGIGFQVDQARELSKQGHMGLLGLRERIELSGGDLDIQSRPGYGSTLFFKFALASTFNPESS